MSEYQFYEFRAIAKPLTSAQQAEVRRHSSRATISATSFVNEYNWGDFGGSVEELMTDYFDVHVYWANWNTHIFSVRLPHGVLDPTMVACFIDDDSTLEVDEVATGVILTFRYAPEDAWDEPEWDRDWMADLITIYHDLIRGDLRSLYIAWLAGMSRACWYDEEELDQIPEPPVPANLGELSPALFSLAEFMNLDDDWLDAAVKGAGSAPPRPSVDPMDGLEDWLAQLPEPEKNQALLKVLRGDAATSLRSLWNSFITSPMAILSLRMARHEPNE